MIIQDGTGKSFNAKVTSENRLSVNASTLTRENLKLFAGKAFAFSTEEPFTITGSGQEYGLFYIRNNEENDLILTDLNVRLTSPTSGSGPMILKFYRNPTGGTLISNGNDNEAVNRNLGSNEIIDADCKFGTGDPLTLVSSFSTRKSMIQQAPYTFMRVGDPIVVIPKGKSYSATITPPTGNISTDVYIALLVYLNGEDF